MSPPAACECDERGSLYDGVCESVPNEKLQLPAGHCHCKEKVTGPRCDRCLSGYWNFTSENPAGCQGQWWTPPIGAAVGNSVLGQGGWAAVCDTPSALVFCRIEISLWLRMMKASVCIEFLNGVS